MKFPFGFALLVLRKSNWKYCGTTKCKCMAEQMSTINLLRQWLVGNEIIGDAPPKAVSIDVVIVANCSTFVVFN